MRTIANDELAKLKALEENSAEHGGVVAARQILAEIEQRQDCVDKEIEGKETELYDLRTEQSAFASGDDSYIKQCLAVLSDAMQHRDIYDLTQLARSTRTMDDDTLINDLRNTREYEHELQQELEQHRNLHQEHLRRLRELEDVRHRFKRHRFDDYRSGFDNSDMLLMLMRQVLTGTVSGGSLWDAINRYQHHRDVGGVWPDFGSGGIFQDGRVRHRPPTWHWPGKIGPGGGGFRLPRGGGSMSGSRGGFRTGGGF